MPRCVQFYKDSTCTELWASVPVVEIPYNRIYGNPIMVEGFSARDRGVLDGTGVIKTNPFLSYARMTDVQRYYCKNGYSLDFGMASSSSTFRNYMYGSTPLDFSDMSAMNDSNNHPRYWAIGFAADGKHYIGFTRVLDPNHFPDYLTISSAFEDSFWTSALRPPYDYGTKPDGGGGQGDGKIPHTPIGFSTKPTISLPTGEHGLHAYRIDSFAYDDFQSYLWGQGSTLAKNLWQKFVNSKTNPAGCVVACYRLPRLFMPTGTVTNGIRIAGVKMPRGVGIIQEVSLGFTDYAVKIGRVEAPFGSWADYCGATVTISIPLCGEFTAPLEKVWDRDVFVLYRVDLSNGNLVGMACTGTCAEDGSSYSMDYLLGEMSGNVAYNVPISGGDDGTLARIGAAVGLASNVISGVTTAVQNVASTFAGGNGGSNMTPGQLSTVAGIRGGVGAAMTSSSLHSMSDIVMPPFQSHLINPNLSGNISACSNGIAYAEYQIACIAYPPNYGDVMGYPARSSGGRLRDFTGGYGEFYVSADFDIHGATYEEKEEIVALLESGVFV